VNSLASANCDNRTLLSVGLRVSFFRPIMENHVPCLGNSYFPAVEMRLLHDENCNLVDFHRFLYVMILVIHVSTCI
jgi:hypothetical protein